MNLAAGGTQTFSPKLRAGRVWTAGLPWGHKRASLASPEFPELCSKSPFTLENSQIAAKTSEYWEAWGDYQLNPRGEASTPSPVRLDCLSPFL